MPQPRDVPIRPARRGRNTAARALTDHPPETVAAAAQSIREALTPLVKGQSVPLDAAIWIVTARAG